MSVYSEYQALKKKKKNEEEKAPVKESSVVSEYKKIKSEKEAKESRRELSPVYTGFKSTGLFDTLKYKADSSIVEDLIAPMPAPEKKDKWYEGWFQKGALEDGTNEENVSKTILGTLSDFGEDFLAGIIDLPEKAIDAFTTLSAYSLQAPVANPYTGAGMNADLAKRNQEIAEEAKKEAAEFVAKDLYDEGKIARQLIANTAYVNMAPAGTPVTPEQYKQAQEVQKEYLDYLENDMEKDSVLGQKSDAVVQSAGQLAVTSAVAPVVPWWLVSGTAAFGSEAEEAFKSGASYNEAYTSAAISAGAEVLTEKLSGGIKFGKMGTLDDGMTKMLARSISNKFVRNGLKLGMDVLGEGAEEWLTEDISRFGKWLTYQDEKTLKEMLFSEEAIDAKIEAFIGGAALGGMGGATQAVQAKADGKDYTSGLTANEQKVVDKLYQDALQAKKDGKTDKTKAQLYDDILEDMEKGYISTDTIEEVLGGENYQTYKKMLDEESSIREELKGYQTEYDSFGDHLTLEDTVRKNELPKLYADAKAKLEDAGRIGKRDSLKAQLDQATYEMVKGDKLVESFFEQVRGKQKYQNDASKYTGKARDLIQQVIDSGLADNSNQSHEFWDFAAKLANNRDMDVSLASNEQILDMVKAEWEADGRQFDPKKFEGKVVDAFYKDGKIVLNASSKRAARVVMGHEITHSLEKSGHYESMQKILLQYAESKGELESRRAERGATHDTIFANDPEAQKKIDKEVTADLAGDYFFTDKDFIQHLLAEDKTIFQKAWDEVKYLAKIATGGEQKRLLEQAKREYERAWRDRPKADGDARYSIREIVDQNQKSYGIGVHLDSTLLDNLTPAERVGMVKEYVKELGGESFTAYDQTGSAVDITIAKHGDKFVNRNGKRVPANKDLTNKYIGNEVKQESIALIDELIVTAEFDESKAPRYPHGWLDNNGQNNWEYWTTYIQDKNNTIWEATLNVANTADGEKILYDISPIKKVGRSIKLDALPTNANIAQNTPEVKEQFSLSENTPINEITDDGLTMTYVRVPNQNTQNYGSTYGQNIEPAGEYMSMDTLQGKNKIDGYEYGTIQFKKPLVLEHINTSDTGWKKTVSDMYGGLTGKKLTKALIKDGYDAIVTYDDYGYSEIVNLNGKKLKDSGADSGISFSLTDYSTEEKKAHNKAVLDYFGKTYKWAETGYVLLDGSKLDLSGKHEGAPGGYRTVDHRDIVDALGSDYGDDTYSGSLVQFMSEGNIRISPESNGINLSVKPNKAQEMALSDFISRARGEVLLDIDDFNGYTVASVEYPRGTHANKVLNDIREWFDNGKQPEVSNLSQFRYAMSNVGDTRRGFGSQYVSLKDMAFDKSEAAPVRTDFSEELKTVSNMESVAPAGESYSDLLEKKEDLESRMMVAVGEEDFDTFNQINGEYAEIMARIEDMEQYDQERVDSLDDAEAPPEMEAPYYGEAESAMPENPFDDRDWNMVGNQKVKAYMFENPEVKPFFQEEALKMLGELGDTTKGERWYNDQLYYESGGEAGFGGTKRHTSASMEELLDSCGMSYADIEKGLNAIIEDHGAENIAAAKKLEFMINDRLLNGYKDFYTNGYVAPNQDYINLLNEKQITEYSQEAFASFMENADAYAPLADDIGPVKVAKAPVMQTTQKYEAIKPKREVQPKLAKATAEEQQKIAEILDEEPSAANRKNRAWAKFRANVFDKGSVFEDLSLKTKNRSLMGKWNFMLYSEARAQRLMGNGTGGVKSLNAIREEVGKTGKTKQFQQYLYHRHNIDRMTLEERYEGSKNKPVFGKSVTADVSRTMVAKLEAQNPKFQRYANDVYGYMTHLRQQLVDGGVISQETAKLWAEMYPNYVPIRRAGDTGLNINVPLDTHRTGVNAPVKKATGGSRDILPLFDTMGQRTVQTYKAVAKNGFGVELKNTLRTTVGNEVLSVDDVIDSIDMQEGLLQEGKNGQKPTFTVFENGEKVTFEITEDMYDALKPVSEGMSYTNKVLNTASNFHRGLLTEYNPVFLLTNAVKDTQDILINSQHPLRTYLKIPEASIQMFKKGYWYQEYMNNGGEQNTYFDNQTSTFKEESTGLKKIVKLPLDVISAANNFIEMTPRLAEYIASREAGRSVEVAMLDAARVTTNFAAGGDLTKMLNRNGVTFLNASVQGAMQQVRNVREANANGWKGWANLATKFVVAGLPAILLNNLLWDDDEEYEELSDYVKQNYYIVGKYGDGNFIRIPKGRTLAVIQEGIEQISNALTGDDEVDLKNFLVLVVSNLAPNNPLDNNILAPIIQAVNNETWYGEDLVPTRLQDLPAGEQFDESTDSVSKWLGDKLNISPVKINYLLNQYSGGVGDVLLPMITPKAERGDDSILGNMIAPLKDKFTTNVVMNNQNVSDFYDLKDKLTTNAKASGATDKDILMSKYINSVNSEMAGLYQLKREVQNSNLSSKEKYAQVQKLQEQINMGMKDALNSYTTISYEDDSRTGEEYARIGGTHAGDGSKVYKRNDDGEWEKLSDDQLAKYEATKDVDGYYATDGKNHYRWYEPEEDSESEPAWKKITDEQLEKQEEVTSALRISPEEYWGGKEEYDYAYEYPENYAVAKAVGGYDAYRQYSSELFDIKADKDEYGKSISGSRKEKVQAYINSLDADYYTKLILYKSEYTSYDDENYEIVEYLNNRADISYEEMRNILIELGFKVDAKGNISWD